MTTRSETNALLMAMCNASARTRWDHYVDEHGAIVSQDTAVTEDLDYPSESYDRVMADIEAHCGPREGYSRAIRDVDLDPDVLADEARNPL